MIVDVTQSSSGNDHFQEREIGGHGFASTGSSEGDLSSGFFSTMVARNAKDIYLYMFILF